MWVICLLSWSGWPDLNRRPLRPELCLAIPRIFRIMLVWEVVTSVFLGPCWQMPIELLGGRAGWLVNGA